MDKTKLVRNDNGFNQFKDHLTSLQSKYDVELVQLFELLSEKEIFVPLSVFSKKISTLETISKYLHENLNLSFKKIGELMNRSEKTIWQAYKFSKIKHPEKLKSADTKYIIPVSVFANRKLSNLEAIVYYIKNTYYLKFSQIGPLLKRDQRTIWTVYSRAKKKYLKE